eukprot:6207517-Pleurochrysis_carterae.AAC.1
MVLTMIARMMTVSMLLVMMNARTTSRGRAPCARSSRTRATTNTRQRLRSRKAGGLERHVKGGSTKDTAHTGLCACWGTWA